MLPSSIKRKLFYLPERLILRIARRYQLGPVRLFVPLQSRDRAEKLRNKTAAALDLIKAHSPKCYARVCRFIPNILIFGSHAYSATFTSELRLCDISRHYALADRTTPPRLAETLVHEATHGYLDACGIKYQEDRRARIENVCIKTEIALARRLPDSADLIAEREEGLRRPSDYWKTEAFVQRDLEHMRNLGTPRWVVAFLERRVTKRLQRRATSNANQTKILKG